MKLLLNNFRCFTGKAPTEFVFEDGKLILLKGQSGTGKSTILEAIKWCLYGNIRGIYPSGFTPSYGGDITGKSKTFVTLNFDNFTITRSQAPEQLRVFINNASCKDNELVQESAQHYIDSLFGNKNVWIASSFVKQNERCPLMTASNVERMSLLNEILFGNDITNEFENPDFYIEKIESKLESLDKEITSQTAIFNNYYTKYIDSLKNFTNPYGWTTMNQELINSMKVEAENIKLQIQDLTESLINITKLEEKKKLLIERLSDFKLTDFNIDEIKSQILSKSNDKNKIVSEIIHLKQELQIGVSNQTRFTTLYQELENLNKIKSEFDESLKTFKSTELQLEINRIKSNLFETQKRELSQSQLQRQKENLIQEISILEASLSKYENKNLDELKIIILNSELYIRLQNLHSKILQIGPVETSVEESQIAVQREKLTSSLHKARYVESVLKKYNITFENIEIGINDANEKIIFHQTQKEHLEKARHFKTLKSQEDDLIKKIIPVSDNLTESEVNERISSIESRLGTPLKCPNCNCSLEYKNNILIIPESEIISKEEGTKEILRLKQLKNALILNRDIEQKLLSIKTSLSLITFDEEIVAKPILQDSEVLRLQGLIRDCSGIKSELLEDFNSLKLKLMNLNKLEEYYKLSNEYRTESSKFNVDIPVKTELAPLREAINNIPSLENSLKKARDSLIEVDNKIVLIVSELGTTSSKEINDLLIEIQKKYESVSSYEKIMNKILNLEFELNKIELKDISVLETNIKNKEELLVKINEELNLLNINKNKLEEYLLLNTKLEETIKEITIPSQDIVTQIENNRIKHEVYSNKLIQATYMLNLLSSKTELESLQKALIVLTTKQANLNRMKGFILDVTNSALQDLVDKINNTTNNILDELFETGLSIELKLYKELKGKQSGAKTKPYVNLSVSQNGNIFDLTAMSGGEATRISLALTIALAVIHPTPFVMLDEVMASLDMNLRENCIDVMKKYLIEGNSSRCVIDVEHLFIEGYYDSIIPLGCC